MSSNLGWVPPEDLGAEVDYLKALMDRAFNICLQISMTSETKLSEVSKSITLPMMQVNKARYKEAERKYRYSVQEKGYGNEMTKEEFTSLSAIAALHYASHLIEALSLLRNDSAEVPVRLAGCLSVLSMNMERCFVNYVCFLNESAKRDLLNYAEKERGSRSKGGLKSPINLKKQERLRRITQMLNGKRIRSIPYLEWPRIYWII